MHEASRSAPLLVTAVLVTGFVLLFVYTTPTPTDARGDPLVILHIPEMKADEECRDTFSIERDYERMTLSYQFDVAIKPRITVIDPHGTAHPAKVEDRNLTLEIPDPQKGEWALTVTLEPVPGLTPVIRDGSVFLLGFPATEGGGTRPSICLPSMSST